MVPGSRYTIPGLGIGLDRDFSTIQYMCVNFIVLAENKLRSHEKVQKQVQPFPYPYLCPRTFLRHFVLLNLKYAHTENEIYVKSVIIALYDYVEMA